MAMRLAVPAIALVGLMLFPLTAKAQGTRINSVDPLTAKVGDVVNAQGEGLGSAAVDELYLTTGTADVKVEIVEQSDKAIKFKVPSGAKSGRWTLMTHLKSGTGPKLVEQPVKLTVE
jgi:hypothetical protein